MYNYRPVYSAALAYFVAGVVGRAKDAAIKLFIVITVKMLTMLCKSLKKEGVQGVID
jgi:hypothetical protein